MAISSKFSRSGVCFVLGILGAAGAQTVACSSKFSSCYEHRTCPAGDAEAGAAGDESGGRGGERPGGGASGAGQSGAVGSTSSGSGGTGEPGGSSEAGEGGTNEVASGGTSGGGAAGSSGAAAGGTAGAAPVCSACANGFACSTTTCKTTCSADADCLADHFCSSGECRVDAVQVSIGSSHACILLADKTVRCWGKNDLSQLGTASTSDSASPVQVKFLSEVQSITVGAGITFALMNDGTVVFWGTRYTAYNLGTGQFTTTASQYPTLLDGLSAVKQLGAGGRANGCAVLADGSVRCWGLNEMGQLGNGTWDFSAAPVVVSGVNGATGIAFGYSFACAQTASAVKCWGNNFNGQLGSYADSVANTPQSVAGLSGTVSKLRTTGDGDLACALMVSGSIHCWGIGYNDPNGVKGSPVAISTIPGVIDLALGGSQSSALLNDGSVRSWTGTETPTTVQGISGAVAIGAGSGTTCVALSNGSVKCWGHVVGSDAMNYAAPTTTW